MGPSAQQNRKRSFETLVRFASLRRPPMSAEATRKAILDAAELLLARDGFAATSLRALTGQAGVNLAAVHYHFGSKEELAMAVLSRRFGPVNAERCRQLEQVLHAGTADVPSILRAFLAPVLQLGREGEAVCAMIGRLVAEQPAFLRPYLAEQFRPVAQQFVAALQRALPQLGADEIYWRLHFVIGAMVHTMQHARLMGSLTHGVCNADDGDAILEQLVAFAGSGMDAPSCKEKR